jgi:hypothetical protein
VQLITVTLDDKTSKALDRWLAKTAAATGPPPLTAEEAIPAMFRRAPGRPALPAGAPPPARSRHRQRTAVLI